MARNISGAPCGALERDSAAIARFIAQLQADGFTAEQLQQIDAAMRGTGLTFIEAETTER